MTIKNLSHQDFFKNIKKISVKLFLLVKKSNIINEKNM